jgi:hypothetical protein
MAGKTPSQGRIETMTFNLNQKMPSSAEITAALEDFSNAWGCLSSRETLRDRIMKPRDEDKGLNAVLFILLTAFDVTKTTEKDKALNPEEPFTLFNSVQAEKYLGLGKRVLNVFRSEHRGPVSLKQGRRYYYRLEDLNRWRDERRCTMQVYDPENQGS